MLVKQVQKMGERASSPAPPEGRLERGADTVRSSLREPQTPRQEKAQVGGYFGSLFK